MKKLSLCIASAALLVTSVSSQAKTFLSLDLGNADKQQITKLLDQAKASYDTNFGYKGYVDLPMYKVNHYQAFNKHGSVDEAWLHFSPSQKLYKFSVTYADAGSLFKRFKDALTTKYRLVSNNGFGFKKKLTFQDDDVKIYLERNEFGFGNDQKTTLIYEYTPLLGEVETMKVRIEQAIRKKNAQQAGDL